jgi:Flp pilus assembly protein TadB
VGTCLNLANLIATTTKMMSKISLLLLLIFGILLVVGISLGIWIITIIGAALVITTSFWSLISKIRSRQADFLENPDSTRRILVR